MNAHDDPAFELPRPRSLFREGDRVITPMDEVGVVIGDPSARGFVSVRYFGALRRDHAETTLHERYLVRWEDGKPRPRPVRVAFAAARPGL